MNVQGFIEYVYTTITFHFQTEKGMSVHNSVLERRDIQEKI